MSSLSPISAPGGIVRHSYLRDFVYGALDGTVTTFAVVSGVQGGALTTEVLLILGVANLFADGFSMAAGDYLSTKTEIQQWELAKQGQEAQIRESKTSKERELREILRKKGFTGELLEKNAQFFLSDRNRWVDFIVAEKYDFSRTPKSPCRAALVTFAGFLSFGSIPLITYVLDISRPFFWASLLSAVSFALIGWMKSLWTVESALQSAGKTLLLGSLASSIAYLVGAALRHLY